MTTPSSKTIDVSCNHCGAPLQVDEKIRFVTCGACKSRLAVKSSGQAFFTEVLDPAGEEPAQVIPEAKKPVTDKFHNAIQNFVSNPGTGNPRKPSAVAGVISIILGILSGGMLLALVRNGAPRLLLVFAMLFFCGGVYNGFKAIGLAMKERK